MAKSTRLESSIPPPSKKVASYIEVRPVLKREFVADLIGEQLGYLRLQEHVYIRSPQEG